MTTIPKAVTDQVSLIPWRRRVHITPNFPPMADNILKTDVLVFEKDGRLRIGTHDSPYVFVAARTLVFQDIESDCKIIIPSFSPPEAPPGAPGQDSPSALIPGGDGTPGHPGEDGTKPPRFFFYAEETQYPGSITGKSPLTIVSIGGKGGDGGPAGRGGNGEDGFNYYRGDGGFAGDQIP